MFHLVYNGCHLVTDGIMPIPVYATNFNCTFCWQTERIVYANCDSAFKLLGFIGEPKALTLPFPEFIA